MGLFDAFTAPTPPAGPANTTAWSLEGDKDEVIRRLTKALGEERERNVQLEESYRAAIGARKGAVERVRELEDVIRLKEGIFETQEKQIALLERQNASLLLAEQELNALRLDISSSSTPVSESDAAHRYAQLADAFEQLKDALSCPVCYEPFQRDEACYKSWEARHMDAFRMGPQQGAYHGPECPECRVPDPRRGKVRIWALEEIIRLVTRAQRDIASKPYMPPPVPTPASLPPTPATPPAPVAPAMSEDVETVGEVQAEEDAEASEAWAEEAAARPAAPADLEGEGAAMELDPPTPPAVPAAEPLHPAIPTPPSRSALPSASDSTGPAAASSGGVAVAALDAAFPPASPSGSGTRADNAAAAALRAQAERAAVEEAERRAREEEEERQRAEALREAGVVLERERKPYGGVNGERLSVR
ncbi:hypothetical protein JCM10213v2_000982 [Rhodosporidiobolus nylandii]